MLDRWGRQDSSSNVACLPLPEVWYKDSFRVPDMNFNKKKWGSSSLFSCGKDNQYPLVVVTKIQCLFQRMCYSVCISGVEIALKAWAGFVPPCLDLWQHFIHQISVSHLCSSQTAKDVQRVSKEIFPQ